MLDYILLVLSTGLVALKQPFLVLRAIMPYLVLIALFGGFVAWNGGVVLGMVTSPPKSRAF
jgi:alpha-1,2-glucosyltransferase